VEEAEGRQDDGRWEEKRKESSKKEEEARKALLKLHEQYTEQLKPFEKRNLSDEEWHKFCKIPKELPCQLKELMGKFGQRRGNPTRNWRRRQQRNARKNADKEEKKDDRPDNNNNNHRGGHSRKRGGRREAKEFRGRSKEKGGPDDRGEKSREKSREPPRSNRKSGWERKALQAKELQMLYRRAAKKCVEKILGAAEDRKECKIPLPEIHTQMSENYSAAVRGPTKPSWVRDLEREQTDVLDGSFTTEEIRRQLRRLPARLAPGPDGVTYVHWKRLDPEGKLITTIYNICRRAAHIPPSWKTSTTILAYKNKGDEADLGNW